MKFWILFIYQKKIKKLFMIFSNKKTNDFNIPLKNEFITNEMKRNRQNNIIKNILYLKL